MPEQTLKKMSYAEAVNAALRRALETRPEVILFGEDVGVPGGVFGVTKGLHNRFGDRVFDTPISESAILGGAIGSAMFGMRPIAEIMWADFFLVALDQIVNQAANVRYVSRGEATAPITVRTQQGSGPGACAQHSQSLEALFAHIPGIRVCMPATHQDAYDLLLSAIWCDDPVIVIENRNLYHASKREIVIDGNVEPIGRSAVRRPGTDITVVTWGSMQFQALEAAEHLAEDGIDAEVIDARWIRPLDMDAVLRSIERTGRLAVVHEAHTIGGVGAEIVSAVVESGIALRAAPVRVGTPAVRIPAAPTLAEAVIPSVTEIADAIVKTCRS
ncbi:alpha-ketoacid dehydrogenase subunit beta [Streptomyces violaceusniger]|uniref:alpha-ketoacid dehydrogenase subunit beta n=1 Tax=Streptomyces violaceusniger TaxID=68280 RepID=UPI00099892ED|nr:transketolase C-terminal domain-containing protein [Streptomyces hygroscopicus]AQW48340.1 acetoin dehydrogenase [Streptomyces hygroscopicus]